MPNFRSDPRDRARVPLCVRAAPGRPRNRRPRNRRRLRRNRLASPSSRIKRLAAAHRSQQRLRPAGPRSAPFLEKKSCLSPPDKLLTSYSLPPPKRALPAYQDVVDAVRNPVEHQEGRNSFARYLRFLEQVYQIFLHFHVPDFSPFFMEKNPVGKTTFFSIFMEKNLA